MLGVSTGGGALEPPLGMGALPAMLDMGGGVLGAGVMGVSMAVADGGGTGPTATLAVISPFVADT